MSIRSPLRSLLAVLALVGTSALVGIVGAPGASADNTTNTTTPDTATPRIPGVYYQIQARHSARCLDVTGASTADAAPVNAAARTVATAHAPDFIVFLPEPPEKATPMFTRA